VPIGPWIVDFACLDPKLVIEIDDGSHDWRDETPRTEYLWDHGFKVLRFRNEEVAKEIHGVIATIENWVKILSEGGNPEV
jgi:very-short-patch-repair endonuclease